MSIFSLKNNEFEIAIDSNGAKILSWRVKNPLNSKFEEIFYETDDLQRVTHLCFPFSGRLQGFEGEKMDNIKIHGFAKDVQWRVKKLSNGFELILDSNSLSKKIMQEYNYEFLLKYKLTVTTNKLNMQISTTNRSKTSMPISPGVHTYYKAFLDQKKELNFENSQNYGQVFDDERKVFDNLSQALSVRNWEGDDNTLFLDYKSKKTTFHCGSKKLSIVDNSNSFKWLWLWSGGKGEGDNFVCIEPNTNLVQGIKKNPIKIKPSETFIADLDFLVVFDRS